MPHRGDIVAFRPVRSARGHEQRGGRYAVLVQSDDFEWLSTALVVPTSASAQPAIFRPAVKVGGRSTLLLIDQLSTVDRTRLGRRVGRLTPTELEDVEECLARLLALR